MPDAPLCTRPAPPPPPHPRSARKRKKVEEPLSDDEDHGDFDPQQLREHEEFTKVKNIDAIQLGMYEMETWYFSPFPPEYKDCKVRRPGRHA